MKNNRKIFKPRLPAAELFFQPLSERLALEDAWRQVQAGNFEQYIPFVPGDVVHATGCELRYLYDTKGFYQPVYAFGGYLNDPENLWSCSIPALKN